MTLFQSQAADLDSHKASMTAEKFQNQYCKPLALACMFVKATEHKNPELESSCSWQRMKVCFQTSADMRCDLLSCLSEGKKVETIREVAMLLAEIEDSKKVSKSQKEAAEKQAAAAASEAALAACSGPADADLENAYSEVQHAKDFVSWATGAAEDDPEPDLLAAQKTQHEEATKLARVKASLTWDRITKYKEVEDLKKDMCVSELEALAVSQKTRLFIRKGVSKNLVSWCIEEARLVRHMQFQFLRLSQPYFIFCRMWHRCPMGCSFWLMPPPAGGACNVAYWTLSRRWCRQKLNASEWVCSQGPIFTTWEPFMPS